MPPLREREGDVEIFARHFLSRFMQEIPALRGKRLSQEAIDVLRRYEFPGNVRELKNIIERAAYRDTTDEITPEDIGMLPKAEVHVAGLRHGKAGLRPDDAGDSFEEKVESFRKTLILEALQEASGNQAKAARILGLSYHQFRYYHKKYSATS